MDNITNIINWLTALASTGEIAEEMTEQAMETVIELFAQDGFGEAFSQNVEDYIGRATPIAMARLADMDNGIEWLEHILGSAFATGMTAGIAVVVLAGKEGA